MSSFRHPQRHLIVQDIVGICTYRNQALSGTPLKARHREAKITFQKVSGFHFFSFSKTLSRAKQMAGRSTERKPAVLRGTEKCM